MHFLFQILTDCSASKKALDKYHGLAMSFEMKLVAK